MILPHGVSTTVLAGVAFLTLMAPQPLRAGVSFWEEQHFGVHVTAADPDAFAVVIDGDHVFGDGYDWDGFSSENAYGWLALSGLAPYDGDFPPLAHFFGDGGGFAKTDAIYNISKHRHRMAIPSGEILRITNTSEVDQVVDLGLYYDQKFHITSDMASPFARGFGLAAIQLEGRLEDGSLVQEVRFRDRVRVTGPGQSAHFSANLIDPLELVLAPGRSYILRGSGFVQVQLHAANVPEPGAWAMLVAGFGLVGAAMRRRNLSVEQA